MVLYHRPSPKSFHYKTSVKIPNCFKPLIRYTLRQDVTLTNKFLLKDPQRCIVRFYKRFLTKDKIHKTYKLGIDRVLNDSKED